MGTNFYLNKKDAACPSCGRSPDPVHIGKSSGGWCFALHVYPEIHLDTLELWEEMWNNPEFVITDEYGNVVNPAHMSDIVKNRANPKNKDWDWGSHLTAWPSFYKNEEDFHQKNYSVRGPNGLLRRKIDGTHCIAHGPGTWDLITGDFS